MDRHFRGLMREELRQVLAEEREATVAAVVGELRKLQAVDLLTTAEAAELARVEPKTIRRWVQAGKLSRHYAGKDLRIVRTELLALLGCASVVRPAGQNDVLTDEEIETKVTAILGATR